MGEQVVSEKVIVAQTTMAKEEVAEQIALFHPDGTVFDGTPNYVASGVAAAMVAGTIAVTDPKITATSKVRLYLRTAGGTVGAPFVSALSAGTGFTIKSTSSSDTSVIAYEVVSY